MSTDKELPALETVSESKRRTRTSAKAAWSHASLFQLLRSIGNRASERILELDDANSSTHGSNSESQAPEIVHEVLGSPGKQLDERTRTLMQSRLGHDFSEVRVHSDAKAADSARAVNARAYTVGHEIVFAQGEFQPNHPQGQALLAHELAHTVQQAGSRVLPQNLSIGHASSDLETEADHASQAFATGVTFRPGLQTSPMVSKAGPAPVSAVSPPPPLPPAKTGETGEEEGPIWVVPPKLRKGAVPIYDSEQTHAVIGFKYSSGGYWEVYDLEGNLVDVGEVGLEHPLIDPIDIFAGLLAGSVFSGGRAAVRGLGAAGEKAVAETAAETGLRAVLRSIGRKTLDAIRATYRALRFRGTLNFTETAGAHMADPARRVPQYILRLAIRFGARSADPQSVPGAFRYVITMFRSGKPYTLEVILREADQTVLHFLYR